MDPATALVAIGMWLFAPRPKVFQPKPDTAAVAAAQAQANEARALREKAELALGEMQRQMEVIRREQEAKRNDILGYAQETSAMAEEALRRVPDEHRTIEVVLAQELTGKTGGALRMAIGNMSAEQQRAVLDLVAGLLSKQAEEREAARRAMLEKDAALALAGKEMAVAKTKAELLGREVEERAAAYREAKAEVGVREAKLESKTAELMRVADRLRSEDGFFWRVILYIVGGWLWFTRVLPALAHVFPAFAWLQRFNTFVFHLLTGSAVK